LSVQLREEADALAARGDYQAALAKYQAAVKQDPDDVSLRFALGTALSHLGRRQETVAEFGFVVSRGNPNSPEFQAAQRWLISAGELAETAVVAPAASPQLEEASAPAPPQPPVSPPASPQMGRVKVRTEPRPGTREIQIILRDVGQPAGFDGSVKPGEGFEFANVPPGKYRLTAQDGETGAEILNQEVTVVAGKDVVVELK
jgi:tetratricopeptide (TPR) repeat protein